MGQRIEVELDAAGRLVLPSATRALLGLVPGMVLVVEPVPEDAACLRVERDEPILIEENGIIVADGELALGGAAADSTSRERERRVEALLRRVRA